MKDLLLDLKTTTVDTAKDDGKLALAASQIEDFNRQYREIVSLGLAPYLTELRANAPPKHRRKKQSKTENLPHRFDKYQTQTLRFMNHFRLPFDNNQAERNIRMTQVKQKISRTFRSANGTPYFCWIRGFISTLKNQRTNLLDALTHTFILNPPVQLLCEYIRDFQP